MTIRPLARALTSNAIHSVHPFKPSAERKNVEKFLFGQERKKNPVVITPYHWPDIDGIACTYGLQELLKQKGYAGAKGMYAQKPQREAEWVMEKLGVAFPRMENWLQEKRGDEDVILVDASDPTDLPAGFPMEQIALVIDHRPYFNTRAMPKAQPWISMVGSASTLVGELYLGQGIIPDRTTSQLLYAAIMSNTVKLRTRNTTDKDKYMVNFLQGLHQLDEFFINEMFVAKSDLSRVHIYDRLFEDISTKLRKFGDYSTMVAQLEVVGAELLIKDRKEELMDAFAKLKEYGKAEKIFLVAIDVFKEQTFFFFEDEEIRNVVSQKFDLKRISHYSFMQGIVTRKEVIGAFV